MEIIPCGTPATINLLSKTPAVVTAACIRFIRVTYELSYFNNGELKTVWLDAAEFTVGDDRKLKVGFK